MRPLVALLLLVVGCGHGEPAYLFVPADPEQDTCLLAFASVRDAWRQQRGELDEKCTRIDETVEVRMTEDMPCSGVGCIIDGVMYISASLSWHTAPSVAVHEWTHVLAGCAEGDDDRDHMLAGLWGSNDPDGILSNTIESIAVRAVAHGPCLGDPGDAGLP